MATPLATTLPRKDIPWRGECHEAVLGWGYLDIVHEILHHRRDNAAWRGSGHTTPFHGPIALMTCIEPQSRSEDAVNTVEGNCEATIEVRFENSPLWVYLEIEREVSHRKGQHLCRADKAWEE